MSELIFTALFVLLTVYILHSLFKIYQNYQTFKQIPGTIQFFERSPIKIPILAPHLYLSGFNAAGEYAAEYLKKHPEEQTVRIITNGSCVVLTHDPKLAKEVFITKANHYEKMDLGIIEVFGENIVTSKNNEIWKKHFKVCSPAFSPANLKFMCQVATESCDLLFKRWQEQINNNFTCLVTKQDFSDITFNVLGVAGLNVDFGVLTNNQEGKIFKNCVQDVYSLKAMIIRGVFPSYLQPFIEKFTGLSKSKEYCSNFLDNLIRERREKIENGQVNQDDILSMLVEANAKEKTISDMELKSNAIIMSFAGHDTTSLTLQWTLYEISKRKDVQQLLYEEVCNVLQGRDPTIDDYNTLNYVNAVLVETLRKDGPVPTNGRIALKKTTLGSLTIPKGTQVYVLFDSIHKRDDFFENPHEFNPQRFVDPDIRKKAIETFLWLPFSIGNRACLGKTFAMLEACMILTKMVREFEFELLNDESSDPVVGVSLPMNTPSDNMKIKITKRVQ